MINHIDIKNFAIIKELKLDLKPGLNIITGETGAGKSIIIEAISMALGARADTDYIRTGEEKAVISMVCDGGDPEVSALLEEAGIEDDDVLIIQRDISASRKSICRVNGSIAPLSLISRICRHVADIHGQYDNQYLLDPENHVEILDLYGGPALLDLKRAAEEAYSRYAKASSELMQLRKTINKARRQKELLSFELGNIRAASPQPGEDEDLEEKIHIMQNSEAIYSALSGAYEAVFGGDEAAVGPLGFAVEQLNSVEKYSADIKEVSDTLSDAYYRIDDLNKVLRRLRDSINFEPEELNTAIERLEELNSLKRRYGGSIEAVLQYADDAEEKLKMSENAEERVSQLEKLITQTNKYYMEQAEKLSAERRKCAESLDKAIDRELSELNFHNARFRTDIKKGTPGPNGIDSVEFLISTNTGEDLRPLAKIASGGELSRIMLAMKNILGSVDKVPAMIFDEIDAGISGATAGIVGKKLKAISRAHQIICITHLPQIAAMGDHHYRIETTSDEISTQTTVVPLTPEQRVEEPARLLSGTQITDTARMQAKELLSKGSGQAS